MSRRRGIRVGLLAVLLAAIALFALGWARERPLKPTGHWLVAAPARPVAIAAFLLLLLLVSLPDQMPWTLVHLLQQLFGYRPSVFFAALPTFAMLGLAVWMQRSRRAAAT